MEDSFMPATLKAGSDAILLLYLNPSPEWEKEGAMVRSLSEAITDSYILEVIGKECRVLADGGTYGSVFPKVIASSCCK